MTRIGTIAIGVLLVSYGWMPPARAQDFPWPHDPGTPWVQAATPGRTMMYAINPPTPALPSEFSHPATITFQGQTQADGHTVTVSIDTSTDPITVDTHGSTPDAAARAFWAAVIGVYPAACRR